MKERFEVPWGSESVCYWCKKRDKCQTKKTIAHWIMIGSVFKCPIDDFLPDYSRLPEQFKGMEIVVKS